VCVDHKPVLLLGYGNPSRGDDGLGPALLEMIEADREQGSAPDVFDAITDYQLQIEHALDMKNRRLVVFIDASTSASAPFDYSRLEPCRDNSYTSHAMSPAALLAVYEQVCGEPLPDASLLGIRGYQFDLGRPLTEQANEHLRQARDYVRELLLQSQ
jgi:hydrogenase maturation protease